MVLYTENDLSNEWTAFRMHHGILAPIRAVVNGMYGDATPKFDLDGLMESILVKLLNSSDNEKFLNGVRSLFHHMSVPIGYMAACRIDDQLKFGWSLCNVRVDYPKFDRKKGMIIAIKRALYANYDRYDLRSMIQLNLPTYNGKYRVFWHSPRTCQVLAFMGRCYRYFYGVPEKEFLEILDTSQVFDHYKTLKFKDSK